MTDQYHVEIFPGMCKAEPWATVCNEQGFNVLSFPEKPGAKFTSPENAQRICNEMNKAA